LVVALRGSQVHELQEDHLINRKVCLIVRTPTSPLCHLTARSQNLDRSVIQQEIFKKLSK
jgi:hypothetical protein